MAELNLEKYGISGTTEIIRNPSYEALFAEETKAGLEGYEVGRVSELGAVNVMTGIYTGRSPKDKYIVVDDNLGHRVVDLRCVQERQPPHERAGLEHRQGDRRQRAVQQASVRG